MDLNSLAQILVILLAVIFIALELVTLRDTLSTWIFPMRGKSIARRAEPKQFWAAVLWQVAMMVAMLVLGVMAGWALLTGD